MKLSAPNLLVVALTAMQGARTFSGTITDDTCGRAGHASMQMGANDAECAVACISAHGGRYVLYDGKNVYGLTDQRAPEALAGRKVKVVGTLDETTGTIVVESIAAEELPVQ